MTATIIQFPNKKVYGAYGSQLPDNNYHGLRYTSHCSHHRARAAQKQMNKSLLELANRLLIKQRE